jgi:hypothetical protein
MSIQTMWTYIYPIDILSGFGLADLKVGEAVALRVLLSKCGKMAA